MSGAIGISARPAPGPLTGEFIDWWFAPWLLGGVAPAFAGEGASTLARRHGYRPWCDAVGVPADLPPGFDSGWQVAALPDGAVLRHAARLYAAMLAARSGRQAWLEALPLAERRWCMGIALTQPLQALTPPVPALEAWGLAELATVLASAFAGLWPRLRILLDADADADAVQAPVPVPVPAPALDAVPSSAAAGRMLRCWRLCIGQARAGHDGAREAA